MLLFKIKSILYSKNIGAINGKLIAIYLIGVAFKIYYIIDFLFVEIYFMFTKQK